MPRKEFQVSYSRRGSFLELSFLAICFLLVVLYEPLSIYVTRKLAYLDEVLVLLMSSIALIQLSLKKKIKFFPFEKGILFFSFLILVLGMLPLLIYEKQDLIYGVFDAVVFFKSLAMYFACRVVFADADITKIQARYKNAIIFVVLVVFVLLPFNKQFLVFPQTDVRLGMMSEMLFFGHPSRLAFFSAFTFCLLLPLYKSNLIYKSLFALILLTGISSGRIKYMAFVVVAIVALLAFKGIRRVTIRNPKVVFTSLFAILLIFIVGYNQLDTHFSFTAFDKNYGRAVLFYNAGSVASKYFPFGAGFGTYGSYYSGLYYSEIYSELGIDKVYGISANNISFITDTFWPMLLGQFGIIGLFSFMFILYFFFKALIVLYNNSNIPREKLLYLSGGLLMAAILIDSSSDAIYTQNRSVAVFSYVALIVNYYSSRKQRAGTRENENKSIANTRLISPNVAVRSNV